MEEKKFKFCQSCGMPLKKDELGGGTEKDGSKSLKFCSKCYGEGKFKNPEMTLPEMKNLVQGKMKEMGFPKFLGWLFTANMHKLERWKT